MFGEESPQQNNPVFAEKDAAVQVRWIDLGHQLPTAAARRHDGTSADGDQRVDLRLAVLEHLGYGGVLGAEADAARQVESDACIDTARCAP